MSRTWKVVRRKLKRRNHLSVELHYLELAQNKNEINADYPLNKLWQNCGVSKFF